MGTVGRHCGFAVDFSTSSGCVVAQLRCSALCCARCCSTPATGCEASPAIRFYRHSDSLFVTSWLRAIIPPPPSQHRRASFLGARRGCPSCVSDSDQGSCRLQTNRSLDRHRSTESARCHRQIFADLGLITRCRLQCPPRWWCGCPAWPTILESRKLFRCMGLGRIGSGAVTLPPAAVLVRFARRRHTASFLCQISRSHFPSRPVLFLPIFASLGRC